MTQCRYPTRPAPTRAAPSIAAIRLVAMAWMVTPLSVVGQTTVAPPAEFPASRSLVHQVWGMEDGLPLSHVRAVLASRTGYLWLATFDGLVRFDGVRFTIYDTSNHPELPTARFTGLQEDDEGTLWVTAAVDHVVRFAQGRFEVFSLPPDQRGREIRDLRIGQDGRVWVLTNRGLYRVGTMGLEAVPGTSAAREPIHLDIDGSLWMGTNRGALRWRDGEVSELPLWSDPVPSGLGGFVSGPDGVMYIGTPTGVFEARDGAVYPVPYPDGAFAVTAMLRVAPDTVLVAADAGLLALTGGTLSQVDPDFRGSTSGPNLLAATGDGDRWFTTGAQLRRNGQLVYEGGLPFTDITVDREGSVWLASDGLHRFKPSVFDVRGAEDGAVPNVYAIYEDAGKRVWVGSLRDPLGYFADGRFHATPMGRFGSRVQTLAEDGEGRLWVGDLARGGCVTEDLVCRPEDEFLPGHTVKAIYRDRTAAMWVGTDQGIYRHSSGTWTHFTPADGVPPAIVRVFLEASDGSIWFGTDGGGIGRWIQGRIEAWSRRDGFPSDRVRALHELSPGLVLVGTEDVGLVLVALPDPTAPLSTAEVQVLDRGAGLYQDGIHSIVSDGRGRLWMNTNRGIFWVRESEVAAFGRGEISRVRSVAYGASDGLTNPEGNGGVQSAAIRASDGRLWFAMQAGVAIVDPAEIEPRDAPLPVVVEEVRVAGEALASPVVAGAGPLVLAPEERDFEVAYTALSFLDPDNLHFQYRLDGFQSDWVDAAHRRTAFFTRVPPGSYRFEVRAARADGVWHEAQATIPIRVRPFLYETRWFRASLGAGVLLLAFVGLRTRDRRRRARERELEELIAQRTATIEAQAARLREMDETKSRFFTNISHEFRTPLTLTIGPLEDMVSEQQEPLSPEQRALAELSLRSSRRLLKLVNQLMDVAKLEAKAVEVRASKADLGVFVRDVLQAFAPLADRKRIRAGVETPDRPVPVTFDPELLERVLVNLLSNAFKFTPEGGAVAVTLAEPEAGWVTVAVRDSGCGIPQDQLPNLFDRFYQVDRSVARTQPGTGIGLSLVREIVALHDGRLEVESQVGFGSTFTVWLRTGSQQFEPEQLLDLEARPAGVSTLVEEEVALLASEGGSSDFGATDAPDGAGGATPAGDDVPTVLVVEDNEEVASFIRRRLERSYRCVEARNGMEALERARERLPDVVVSDLMMPEMDGLELLKALRADRELAYVPVLLLTAKAGQDHKLEGLDAGAAAYLTKPFDMNELEVRVRGLIEQQQRLRDGLREDVRRRALAHPVPEVDVESPDDRFLARLRQSLEANLADEDFDVRALARAVGESRSNLYRRVDELVGETPSQLIKSVRLERAEAMLRAGAGSIQQVAYAVGFKSVSHFSRSFRERYGVSPSRLEDHPSQ